MDFDELMNCIILRIINIEFLSLILIYFGYIPHIVPRLPPHIQPYALISGVIAVTIFVVVGSVQNIILIINEAVIKNSDTTKILNQLEKNYKQIQEMDFKSNPKP